MPRHPKRRVRQLALLTHAYRRLDQLPTPLAADVRRLVFETLDRDQVLAHGDRVLDEWDVLGTFTEEDERVRAQRTWLRGRTSGRTALQLQFAAGSEGFGDALLSGMRFQGELAFWPSAAPLRALLVSRHDLTFPVATPAGVDVATALAQFADRLGGCPWLDHVALVLEEVRLSISEPLSVVDSFGRSLPLCVGGHELLLAVSGGHPVTLAGEWDGYVLRPLCVWSEGRALPLLGGKS